MTYIIGNMKMMAMITIFSVMLVAIELTPVAPSGWGPIGFGVSPAMASGLICDCTTATNANAAATKAKADDDKAKEDDDKAKEDDDKAKEDDDKAKEDAEKVTLCHAPPGNPNNEHTLRVGESAVDAHINHHPHDHLGACTGDEAQAQQDQEDADQAKADADKTKEDADQAKADADKTKEDADKTKEDADKAKEDADKNVVGAPCSCGNGTTGYWTNATGGTSTPPGGSAPKAERQIHGQ